MLKHEYGLLTIPDHREVIETSIGWQVIEEMDDNFE